MYLRNGTRYKHSYNEILIGTYAVLMSVISNDFEWLSEIFNDTKISRSLCDSWASCWSHARRHLSSAWLSIHMECHLVDHVVCSPVLAEVSVMKLMMCGWHVVFTALMRALLCIVMMQAVHKHMQLEVNRLKWEHAQEIAEIRHNAG